MTSETIGYAILNTDLNRMLTGASGKSVWDDRSVAKAVKMDEFGDEDHLEVVRVARISS